MNKFLSIAILIVPMLFSSELYCFKDDHSIHTKKRIDIVSYGAAYVPSSEYNNLISYRHLQEKYDVHFFVNLYKYVKNFNGDNPNLYKIIFHDYCEDPNTARLPKNKTICFKWEAVKIDPKYYDFYYRVYTFDDDLVDGQKFFKFYYPVLQPMLENTIPFNEKNLCVMVAANFTSERVRILDFFLNKPSDALHVYGKVPPQYCAHEMYRGSIPGPVSSMDKLKVLQKYRFNICFENTHTTPGYITEKIFDAFAAGCVPIYWGPQNIEKYIPTNCFIDYRKFKNNEEMYNYIRSMTEKEHASYLKNIQRYLQSDQAKLFSGEHFDKLLYQAVSE